MFGKRCFRPTEELFRVRPYSRSVMLGSAAVLFLGMAIVVVPAFAQTTSPQFASYSVGGTVRGQSFYALVNESVAPSSASGFSDLTLQITSAMQNLTYSKIVNSTDVIMPYFPTIANQSLTYQFHNYSITATIDQAGTGSVTFDGQTYTVSNFTFNVMVSGRTQTSIQGSASVFPSGLTYTAEIVANGTNTVNVQLQSTNLPLTSQSDPPKTTTSVAVVGGVGSILAGLGAFVVYRRKSASQTENPESKPLYHVD